MPTLAKLAKLAELGVKGLEYEQWFSVQATTSAPNAKEYIGGLTMDAAVGSPDEFHQHVASDA